jgi:hypothetical protein
MKPLKSAKTIWFNFWFLLLTVFFSSFVTIEVFGQEPDNINYIRNHWLFKPRAYPYDTIPSVALNRALEQQRFKEQTQGYRLGLPLQWTSIGPTPYYENYIDQTPFTGRVAAVNN